MKSDQINHGGHHVPASVASYYLWKWAENDLSGPPDEVFADLLRGKLHPALQAFDARPVLRNLQTAAEPHQPRGEEWHWEVLPHGQSESAHAIFLQCQAIPNLGVYCRDFATIAYRWAMSGYDEQRGIIIDCLLAKKNSFSLWELDEETKYDIAAADLPGLLSRLNSNQYNAVGRFWNHVNHNVSCIARPGGFEVEWRIFPNPADLTKWDQWRAGTKLPPGKKSRSWTVREEWVGDDWNWHMIRARKFENELLPFKDTLEIFCAFARNEPRPAQFQWRSLREEFEKMKLP